MADAPAGGGGGGWVYRGSERSAAANSGSNFVKTLITGSTEGVEVKDSTVENRDYMYQ